MMIEGMSEIELLHKKYRDESWDYPKANTKKYTHIFHPYPAMMIPQVAGRILDEYAINASLLFDPYCGTGTGIIIYSSTPYGMNYLTHIVGQEPPW